MMPDYRRPPIQYINCLSTDMVVGTSVVADVQGGRSHAAALEQFNGFYVSPKSGPRADNVALTSIMPGQTWCDNGHKALCPLSREECHGRAGMQGSVTGGGEHAT